MLAVNKAQSGHMSDEDRGKVVEQRRHAIGMSQHDLAAATERLGMKVSRDAIIAAEAGKAAKRTYDRLDAFFERWQETTDEGTEPAAPQVATFRVSGNFGVDVVIEGPVDNLRELEGAVERLIRGMRESE